MKDKMYSVENMFDLISYIYEDYDSRKKFNQIMDCAPFGGDLEDFIKFISSVNEEMERSHTHQAFWNAVDAEVKKGCKYISSLQDLKRSEDDEVLEALEDALENVMEDVGNKDTIPYKRISKLKEMFVARLTPIPEAIERQNEEAIIYLNALNYAQYPKELLEDPNYPTEWPKESEEV